MTRALLGMVLALCVEARAQEAPLSEEAKGSIRVDTERRLHIEGVTGTVTLTRGASGLLEFQSSSVTDEKGEVPIGLWLEEGTFRLAPLPGAPPVARSLAISVPGELFVSARLDGVRIVALGLPGGIEVTGKDNLLEARGLQGSARFELTGGKLSLTTAEQDVTLKGKDLQAVILEARGPVYLEQSGGKIELTKSVASVDAELQQVDFKVNGTSAPVQVRARGGKVQMDDAAGGGHLSLSETPLLLQRCGGEIDVDTDGDVQYRDCRAAIHVNSFGGSLSGQRNTGIVEVITRASKVDLRQNTGDVRIQGDGLELSLNDIGGDIYVQVTGSKVGIEGTAGPLQISNDYGDTVVSRSSGKIQVKSRNGDVRVLDLAGSVEIEADGPLVEVRWTSLPSDRDSAITNDGGDVAVVLPSGTIGRLEAKTRYGRITADSPRVQLTDDGTRAVAIFGRAQRPVIRIEASGDLTLSGGGAGERPEGEHP